MCHLKKSLGQYWIEGMVGLKLNFVFIFQGWVLLMSNASFALGVATEIIRILFLSGYGMVNFVFGVAVYFSALFYLVKICQVILVLVLDSSLSL